MLLPVQASGVERDRKRAAAKDAINPAACDCLFSCHGRSHRTTEDNCADCAATAKNECGLSVPVTCRC